MSRRLLAHLQQEREGGDLATTLPCTSSICPFPTLQLTCCLQPLGASWPHPDCSSAPASTRYQPQECPSWTPAMRVCSCSGDHGIRFRATFGVLGVVGSGRSRMSDWGKSPMASSTRLACSKRQLGQFQIWNLLQQPRTGNLEHVLVFCPCCHSRSCRRCLGKKRFFFCVNSSSIE